MITFNTGRPYSQHGQRIAADFFNDRHGEVFIVFCDIDRHIDGVIATSGTDCQLTHALVMREYDQTRYVLDGPEHAKLIEKLRAAARQMPAAQKDTERAAPAQSLNLF